ncbi:MAG: hypothetical protein ACXVQR_01895 [Solirubrobacteraceae bacterium]
MQERVKVLKQLVGESLYSVDQYAVADAIVLRACVRRTVPEMSPGTVRRRRRRGPRRVHPGQTRFGLSG